MSKRVNHIKKINNKPRLLKQAISSHACLTTTLFKEDHYARRAYTFTIQNKEYS